MKKKFLSSILALAMVLVAMTPVMAEDYKGSPVGDDVKVRPASTTTTGSKEVNIMSESEIGSGKVGLIFSGLKTDMDEKSVNDAVAKLASNEKAVVKFCLTPVNQDGNPLDDSTEVLGEGASINIKLVVDSAKKGDNYFALHVGKEGNTDKLNCTVEDGFVTINGIKECSPFILVKVTSSDSGSSSSTKVVTCEEAEGKGWVWSEAKKACVYSVTNTSTK